MAVEEITFSSDGTGTLKRGAFSSFDLVLSDVKVDVGMW